MSQFGYKLFCFGLGYSARVLADRLLADGWAVAGTCQEAERCAACRDAGIEAHVFDRDHPLDNAAEALKGTTHLLSSVPPDRFGDAVLDHHRGDLVKLNNLVWAGYLSTTGVYGDTGGQMVDETAPLRPTVARSRRRLEAECQWTRLWRSDGVPVQVFRLAGIYGPGRSVFDQIRQGRAKRIEKPDHLFSRIHVDDIANVLFASMHEPNPGAIYNVCDDCPATPAEVTAYACSLMGVEAPPSVPYDEAQKTMSPMAQSFWSDNRRIDNRRVKEELGVNFAYPDYKAGLRAVWKTETRGE